MYLVKGERFHHYTHINQLSSKYARNKQPVRFTLTIEILYDTFEIHIPKFKITIQRQVKRKHNATEMFGKKYRLKKGQV